MKFYVVIDTNVVVSSMLKNDSIPGKVIDLMLNKLITPLVNEEILEEYYGVLTRNKFNISVERINYFMNFLKNNAIYINKETTSEFFIDESDVVFYEVTMTGRKDNMDVYLVTGNMKHFPNKSFIVTPREMLEIINDYFEKDGEA